jgi:L-lactate dehydrogenase complex protein LldG
MSRNSKADKRRQAVLGQVRRSLGVRGDEAARRAIVKGRIENHPSGTIPERGRRAPFKRIEAFIGMAEAADATTARVERKDEVLAAVTAFLRSRDLPSDLVHGADPYIESLDWHRHNEISVHQGPPVPEDRVSLAKAFAGVAETGTLVMLSGPENPITLNFLPFTEIVVIEAKDIAGDYESVWERLRSEIGAGNMPRSVVWVTGPSRSADIGQKLLLGAHGPGNLHIVIVG